MKVAVIGSRGLEIENFEKYLPKETAEIVSGGAKGIDACEKNYALLHGIKFTEFLPEYKKYGKSAPLRRNDRIIEYADVILAFWDGKSRGTRYVIEACQKRGKAIRVYKRETQSNPSIRKPP